METGRSGYGFEISREFCKKANEQMLNVDMQMNFDSIISNFKEEKFEQNSLF